MDIVVDKDKGEVSQERLQERASLEKEILGSEKKVMDAVDTKEERENAVETFEHFREVFAAAKEKLIPAVLRKESDPAFWEKIDDEIDELGGHIDEHIHNIILSIQAETEKARQEAASINKNVRFVIIAILVVGIILSFLVAFFTSRAISKPLKEAVEMLQDIAEGEGNLTRRLQTSGKDEIGQLAHWFNRFIEKLQGMIKAIKEITEGVSSGVLQISSSAEEMSSTAEEQSNQSQSVSSAMTELTATSDDISKSIESTRATA
jgi:methyl-accepting chemotaxis protein